MDDNAPERDPNISQPEPEYHSRREERWRRREERRGGRSGGAWIGGAILIALGIIFLLQNMGAATLENWWALFIVIPAVGAFGNAWRSYQAAGGRLTASARGSLISGLAMTIIAAIFLFNLDWRILGPVIIILVGIGLLLNAFLPG